jgi:polyisoprenoid-binding protein YceI
MHGVTKPVTLPVTFLGTVKDKRKNREGVEVEIVKAGFETAVTLNRKDYGITWNRTLDTGGFMLGDEVYVSINLETNRQTPPATQ